ncbi:YcxB family protein [Actinosynnema sp.]|uniref:YcxB family protein n=1 Tax=Actinosynnema sp. TaxID=1872144 RepID=UPI003F85BB2C
MTGEGAEGGPDEGPPAAAVPSGAAVPPAAAVPSAVRGVDFAWTPHPSDWRAALRTAVPLYRWVPWFAAAFAVFGFVVLVIGLTVPGVAALVLAALMAAMVPVTTWVSFHNHPIAAKAVTGSADDHSLRMAVSGAARSEVDWARLPGWAETGRTFVLRTPESGMYAVPHRAFGSGDGVEKFRALLAEHVGPAA